MTDCEVSEGTVTPLTSRIYCCGATMNVIVRWQKQFRDYFRRWVGGFLTEPTKVLIQSAKTRWSKGQKVGGGGMTEVSVVLFTQHQWSLYLAHMARVYPGWVSDGRAVASMCQLFHY